MGEFNRFLKQGTANLKSFLGTKPKQLNYHATPILSEHQYYVRVIHVGITDLLNAKNGTSITQTSRYITEVRQRCRNHNIGKIFISDLFYCVKVTHELN